MKKLAGAHGAVLVVDERAEDNFTAPASEMERFFYSFSTLHCLAVSLQDGGAGTGTVMRPDTMRSYAAAAGFSTDQISMPMGRHSQKSRISATLEAST